MSYFAAGAVVGTAGSLFSSSSSNKAQKKASKKQLEFEREKLREQQVERRAEIDRSFAGREAGFRDDIINFLKQTQRLSPVGSAGKSIQDTLARLDPSFRAAENVLNRDVFGGGFLDRQTQDQLAINQALEKSALQEVQAIDEATAETIGNVRGRAGRRGFTGASSFDLGNIARERARGRRGAALSVGRADVAGRQGLQRVTDTDINRLLANLTTADVLAGNAAKRTLLPVQAEQAILESQLSPFDFFRINTRPSNLGNVNFQPAAFLGSGATGGAALQGLGSDIGRLSELGAFDNLFNRTPADATVGSNLSFVNAPSNVSTAGTTLPTGNLTLEDLVGVGNLDFFGSQPGNFSFGNN